MFFLQGAHLFIRPLAVFFFVQPIRIMFKTFGLVGMKDKRILATRKIVEKDFFIKRIIAHAKTALQEPKPEPVEAAKKNPSWTNPSNLCNRNLCARQFYSKILSVFKAKVQAQKNLQIGIFRRNTSFFIVLSQKNAAIASRRKFFRFLWMQAPF